MKKCKNKNLLKKTIGQRRPEKGSLHEADTLTSYWDKTNLRLKQKYVTRNDFHWGFLKCSLGGHGQLSALPLPSDAIDASQQAFNYFIKVTKLLAVIMRCIIVDVRFNRPRSYLGMHNRKACIKRNFPSWT